jgi:RNA-splicing ligase RtcB
MKASRPNDAEDTRGEVTTPDADFGSDGALGKKVQELGSLVADEDFLETAESPPRTKA